MKIPKNLKLITLLSFFILSGGVVWSAMAGSSKDVDPKEICKEVMIAYRNNQIKEIIVSTRSEQEQKIDIDNDGILETIKYFPTRTFMALSEIEGNRRITIPMASPNQNYSGADVILLHGKHYILQNISKYISRPYELMELLEDDSSSVTSYKVKTLCSFQQ